MNSENSQLVVVGINHKTSSISEREKFQISKNEMSEALNYFISKDEVNGIVIISTCNRLEFYLVADQDFDPFLIVTGYYTTNKKIDATINGDLFYTYRETDVANHLFHVVCGLESMLLGEYQIQGQIKNSYSIACTEKSADKILHKLFHAALRTGKIVRNKTKIGTGKQSLSGIAFQLIEGKLKKKDVVTIIGVNESTKILATRLNQAGFSNTTFINRTLYKAEQLANKYNGTAYKIENLKEALANSECVFTCTGAPELIITSKVLNKIYTQSAGPKLIIDIAIPRDIDITGIPGNVETYDLEGLKIYLENQRKEIELDLPLAEKIISDETKIFEAWTESQNDDILGPFNEKIESIRLQLLDESRMHVNDEEYKRLENFSRSLLHRTKSIFNESVRTTNIQKMEN
jgi:glutamyl-tRNA reductase